IIILMFLMMFVLGLALSAAAILPATNTTSNRPPSAVLAVQCLYNGQTTGATITVGNGPAKYYDNGLASFIVSTGKQVVVKATKGNTIPVAGGPGVAQTVTNVTSGQQIVSVTTDTIVVFKWPTSGKTVKKVPNQMQP
ncbi:MAG: hypothetical protein NT099_07440, partial [Candidatus Saganbacteria bacterium]|nr:hypothetical protein [Candidatus Saganbacteria bacterium]